jgi:membrane associated rhomboid family serine protease
MSDGAHNPDDYCYRHPDRPSFVLCERCGRTICLECQNHVGGKVLCPDDARRSNVTMMPVNARPPKPTRVRRERQLPSWITPQFPIVSLAIAVILLVVFLVDTFSRGALMAVMPVVGTGALLQPWTLVTAIFYPFGILSVLLGGVNLYYFGRILEPHLGRPKYVALFLISGFGANVFAFLLDGVSGSYGAIAGLVAAVVILARRLGANPIYLYISCAVSLVLSIFLGSWQGFLGGFVTGAAVAFILFMEENDHRVRRSRLLLVVVIIVLLALAFARALFFQLAG